MIELDVCLTKDKMVVVSHDPDLSRSTGHDGLICDYDYEVIFTVIFYVECGSSFVRSLQHMQCGATDRV